VAHATLLQAHLGALLAHIVAVQIDARGFFARTHARRSDLPAELVDLKLAMLGIEAIVAVGVE